MTPRFLTVKQAAELLAVHEDTIRRWIKDRRLPVTKLGPRSTRINAAALENLIERRTTKNFSSRGTPAPEARGAG